ncbi:hypothetical protein DTO027B5_4251 [Paecilomyces variotii]|nr:hypothetical protein DTO027B3_4686 [Paecilomyces variotii]KAJ9333904.1 hypothetical protein DTO027B5_4251 [Paecilomyces variotii]KAJ9403726.1 hypothetical protein DTO045G8_8535 [Paecilomyces variotii]
MIVSLETYSNLCDRGSQHLRVIQTFCLFKSTALSGKVKRCIPSSTLLAHWATPLPLLLTFRVLEFPDRATTILRPHCAFLEKSYRDTITQALALTTAGSVPVPTLDATANS